MVFATSFIKKFAWFSIIVAFLYSVGESYTIFLFGQPIVQTFIDIIAVILLLFGGFITFKNEQRVGVLCGAWGFLFCLNLRAWAWRLEAKREGILNDNTDALGTILFILLIFSCIAFSISIFLNLSKSKIVEQLDDIK